MLEGIFPFSLVLFAVTNEPDERGVSYLLRG